MRTVVLRVGAGILRTGIVATLLVGCGGGTDDDRLAALSSRMDQLEKRLGAAEQAAEPVERLRNDTASLDRRLSSLESGLRDLAAKSTPPPASPTVTGPGTSSALPNAAQPSTPSGPGAWGGPVTRGDRTDRRAALRALSFEFRQKLAELRQAHGNQPPSPEQQQQVQDILQWYRDQRRAVLRGEGRTDR